MENFFDGFLKIGSVISRVSERTIRSLFGSDQDIPASFRTWARKEGSWVKLVFTACILYSLCHFVIYVVLPGQPNSIHSFKVSAWSYVAHALIIFGIFIVVIFDRPRLKLSIDNSKTDHAEDKESIITGLARSSEAIRLLLRFWPFLWFFWFLLYLALAASHFLEAAGFGHEILWFFPSIFNLLNNLSALILFSMYYELSERTVDEQKPDNIWMIALLLVILFWFAEMILGATYRTAPETLGASGLVFNIVSGLLTGVATALLATRLASRILSVPLGAIIFLMVYALVQPLFPMVSSPKNFVESLVGYFAVNIALYGKATLLVVIHWLRSSHRLSYYMIRALELLHAEDKYRRIFVAEFLPKKDQEVDNVFVNSSSRTV